MCVSLNASNVTNFTSCFLPSATLKLCVHQPQGAFGCWLPMPLCISSFIFRAKKFSQGNCQLWSRIFNCALTIFGPLLRNVIVVSFRTAIDQCENDSLSNSIYNGE